MCDQKLVAIHHVSLLMEQLSYLTKQTCNCYIKVSSLVHFDYFPHKHGCFALSVDVFKNIHQKLKSVNVYEM